MRKIPEKIDSKFRFVLLASTRAEQIMRGAMPKVDMPAAKPTRAAMEEVLADKVGWDYGPEQVAEAAGEAVSLVDEPATSAPAADNVEN